MDIYIFQGSKIHIQIYIYNMNRKMFGLFEKMPERVKTNPNRRELLLIGRINSAGMQQA